MELTFDQEHSRRLFEERSYAPDELGDATVHAFRRVVSFLAAARQWSDVEAMRSLRTRVVGDVGGGWYSIELVDPWALRVQVSEGKPSLGVVIVDVCQLNLGEAL